MLLLGCIEVGARAHDGRQSLPRGSRPCFPLIQGEKPVKHLYRVWTEDDGVLAFEWILLVTLLTIGIVGGIAGVRDAVIDDQRRGS